MLYYKSWPHFTSVGWFKIHCESSAWCSNVIYVSWLVLQIQSYFHQVPNTELRLSILKALNTRSLTLKLFVEMVSHLLLHFFRKNIINMSNYADEIPHLAKRLGYPGSVKKSWLITGLFLTTLMVIQGHSISSCHRWNLIWSSWNQLLQSNS